jgi:hypothetical protein
LGVFSNQEMTSLLASLTGREWTKVRRELPLARGVAPDGRRTYGALRDAIIAVLEDAGRDLSVAEIHPRVEESLGEPVSEGSVKAYLWAHSRRQRTLVERGSVRGFDRLAGKDRP